MGFVLPHKLPSKIFIFFVSWPWSTLRIKAQQHLSEDTAGSPIPCARENMQRQNKFGKSAREYQNKKKKINQILMEPFRGIGCQFWVEMALAQNRLLFAVADCSEWGFHQPDFGVGSQLPCVLCSSQNKNPGSEQPRAAGEAAGSGEISARLWLRCLTKGEGPH